MATSLFLPSPHPTALERFGDANGGLSDMGTEMSLGNGEHGWADAKGGIQFRKKNPHSSINIKQLRNGAKTPEYELH